MKEKTCCLARIRRDSTVFGRFRGFAAAAPFKSPWSFSKDCMRSTGNSCLAARPSTEFNMMNVY